MQLAVLTRMACARRMLQYYREFDQHLSDFMGPNPETGIQLDLTLVGGAAAGWHCQAGRLA